LRANKEDLLKAGVDEEKVGQLNRKKVRQYRMSTPKKAGHRTGTTPHFALWKAEGALKSALQKTSTARLADKLSGKLAAAFAVLYVGGYKNVWDVSQASGAKLLDLKGIGPATLGLVEDYLHSKKVELKWTVRD
jgi:hypothetical protein